MGWVTKDRNIITIKVKDKNTAPYFYLYSVISKGNFENS